MAEVLDFGAYSKTQASQGAPPRTRNQVLLAQIDEALAARTPQEVLEAKIESVKEELKANRLRHRDLVERRHELVSELGKLREHGEMSVNQTWSDEQRDARIRELFDTARRAHAAQRSDEKSIFAEIVTALLAHEQADVAGQPEEAWAVFRRECWSYSQEAIEQVLDGYKAKAASLLEMERLTHAAARLKQKWLEQVAFDRVVADLPRLWREDGHRDGGKTWEELDAAERTGYLARHAAKHRVSFEQFVDGAAAAVGLGSSEAFTPDDDGRLLQQLRRAHGDYSEDSVDSPAIPAGGRGVLFSDGVAAPRPSVHADQPGQHGPAAAKGSAVTESEEQGDLVPVREEAPDAFDWHNTPPPTREGVEDQIRRLKQGTEFTTIVEHFDGPPEGHFVDIVQEEKLIGRSWGELTEGQKLAQLVVGTDVGVLIPEERREILGREVDFTRVTLAEQEAYLGGSFDEQPGAEADSPPVRDTTRNLVESIMLDVWPRRGAIVDFGLKSQEHYEALYYPVREGEITPEQLDAALGKGDALTTLARSARSNPHRAIAFRTDWDDLRLEPDDSPAGPEGSRPSASGDLVARARQAAGEPHDEQERGAENNRETERRR